MSISSKFVFSALLIGTAFPAMAQGLPSLGGSSTPSLNSIINPSPTDKLKAEIATGQKPSTDTITGAAKEQLTGQKPAQPSLTQSLTGATSKPAAQTSTPTSSLTSGAASLLKP